MPKKNTTETFLPLLINKYGDKFDYSEFKYIHSETDSVVKCKKHGYIEKRPHQILQLGCTKCNSEKRYTSMHNIFITKSIEIHGNKYNYSKANYIGRFELLTIICPIHLEFKQTADSHLQGHGCSKCSNNCKLTNETFIIKAKQIHGDKYDYSKINYINANSKVIIICPIHKEFEQMPNAHLFSSGCLKCSIIDRAMKIEDFIIKSNEKHYFKYDYSKINYVNNYTKVNIICNFHKEKYTFSQRPGMHLAGQGCPKCASTLKTTDLFIEQANFIHNKKYNYSESIYTNSDTKIKILCPNHNEFYQRPDAHLRGAGCPNCNYVISKGETQWLDSLNIKHLQRNITIKTKKRRYSIDGFDFKTNTIYEFNGDFWHGNPKFHKPEDINVRNNISYGELYQKTLDKKQDLIDSGYNIITIWESDWNKKKDK